MRKSYPYYTIALFALLFLASQSCKKVDGISNNVVIETPYSLYFADTAGALYNTNDGIGIKQTLFTADGYASRAICITGNNILWAKHYLYISTNNGVNFNPTYYLSNPSSGIYQFFLNDSSYNQSLILNAQDEGRVYVATITPKVWSDGIITHARGLGVAYSEQNGGSATWFVDTVYNSGLDVNSGGIIQTNAAITSLTQLKNNTIVAYSPNFNRIFSKHDKTNPWVEHKQSPGNSLPVPNAFTLTHFNNLLVAVDYKYKQGAYYSSDTGVTWKKFSGLPQRNLYCGASPFDQVLLVGTDSFGVYKLDADNSTVFSSANIGLDSWTSVHSIVGKENIYKNDAIRQLYIYMATSKGLYKSQDLGQSWIRVQNGNFVSIY